MYIVVSFKEGDRKHSCCYRVFESKEEAENFLQAEEYDFRVRQLYECKYLGKHGFSQEFIKDWCWEEERAADDELYWNDDWELYSYLSEGN